MRVGEGVIQSFYGVASWSSARSTRHVTYEFHHEMLSTGAIFTLFLLGFLR